MTRANRRTARSSGPLFQMNRTARTVAIDDRVVILKRLVGGRRVYRLHMIGLNEVLHDELQLHFCKVPAFAAVGFSARMAFDPNEPKANS